MGVKQSKQMDALSILMQTADDMLEAVRGKSVIEVYSGCHRRLTGALSILVTTDSGVHAVRAGGG